MAWVYSKEQREALKKQQLKEYQEACNKHRVGNNFTKQDRAWAFNRTNGRCGYCGDELQKGWHIDHIYPLVDGGEHERNNFMASCKQCNLFKNNLTVEGFRHHLEDSADSQRRNYFAFRMGEKYGLINVSPKNITFYFENLCGFENIRK